MNFDDWYRANIGVPHEFPENYEHFRHAFEAGRIMLRRIDSLLDQSKSFAFETTLSSKSFVRCARSIGGRVRLRPLWLRCRPISVGLS